MQRTQLAIGAALGSALLMSMSFPAWSYTGQNLSGSAKISIDQARQSALQAHPGRITDEELEREKGGSGLRYSFDVVSHGVTHEVGVDAVTGAVLENAPEGPNPD